MKWSDLSKLKYNSNNGFEICLIDVQYHHELENNFRNAIEIINNFLETNSLSKEYEIFTCFHFTNFTSSIPCGRYSFWNKLCTINYANPRVTYYTIEEVIIHECSHYIDNILSSCSSEFYSHNCDIWKDICLNKRERFIPAWYGYEERCYNRWIVGKQTDYNYILEIFAISLTEFILRPNELESIFPERYDYFKNHLGFKTL
jgi:hypothetical protein